MKRKIVAAAVLVATAGTMGCFARPLLFWRDTIIMGQTTLVSNEAPTASAIPPPVTVNFINLEGRLEDTLLSVQTDPSGRYRSPKLIPGKYTVEAMLPGYVIRRVSVEVRSHEYRMLDFELVQIGEAEGRTLMEAEDDNIRAPGEVSIRPPLF